MQESTAISERTIAVAALACLSAGLVAGIGARIIMRIVALTSHMPPQFSIGGTFNILFAGLTLGFVAGFIITILTAALSASPKARKYLPGPIWRGVIWGLLLLLLLGPPLFVSASFPNPDISFGIPLLNKCLFAALILLYGITLGVAEKVFDHYLPRKATSASS
jgi:hypothetical protein